MFEIKKEDWKKLKTLAHGRFINLSTNGRDSDWFVARCYVDAFLELIEMKGYKIVKKENVDERRE